MQRTTTASGDGEDEEAAVYVAFPASSSTLQHKQQIRPDWASFFLSLDHIQPVLSD